MDNLTPNQMLKTVIEMTRAVIEQAEWVAAQKGIAIKTYTEQSYRQGIYDAARLFWKEGSRGNFITRMNQVIKFGLNDAWIAGASEVGVEPDEFDDNDKQHITAIIDEEKSHVSGLLDFLDGLANDPNKTLDDASYRLDMWCIRFEDVLDQARVWFNMKGKYEWQYGDTQKHCHSGDKPGGIGCANLAGIVAFGYEWDQAGIKPKSTQLSCGGYNCDCRLSPTTKRRTARALNKIMDAIQGV